MECRSPLFREIHKNTWLKRVTADHRKIPVGTKVSHWRLPVARIVFFFRFWAMVQTNALSIAKLESTGNHTIAAWLTVSIVSFHVPNSQFTLFHAQSVDFVVFAVFNEFHILSFLAKIRNQNAIG